MTKAPGHESGHSRRSRSESGHAGSGLSWGEYVDGLVAEHGSLAAVAERLSRQRAYKDDVGSIERALRRLRTRKQEAGGLWGDRALAAFGLPDAAAARTKWMGQYHSRFTDLPLPLCLDLVRLWDRPPVSEAPRGAAWLALAHASCALRAADLEAAAAHVQRARAAVGATKKGDPAAHIETALVDAFIASRRDPARVAALLDEADASLAELLAATANAPSATRRPATPAAVKRGSTPLERSSTPPERDSRRLKRVSTPAIARTALTPDDAACLRARLVDQRAYTLNRAGDHAAAEALFASLATEGPPFALYRRASGLAWVAWKARGDKAAAAELAREACRHAGDGGHLRLRAMALQTLARILGERSAEANAAKARAAAIVEVLEDEALRLRFRL